MKRGYGESGVVAGGLLGTVWVVGRTLGGSSQGGCNVDGGGWLGGGVDDDEGGGEGERVDEDARPPCRTRGRQPRHIPLLGRLPGVCLKDVGFGFRKVEAVVGE